MHADCCTSAISRGFEIKERNMPSIATAPAASSSASQIIRTLLWDGATVSMKIPTDAKEGSYPADEDNPPNRFVQFVQNVKGGVVNFFYHGDNPELACGTRVIANVEIWRKALPDGRQFLYVDLDPPVKPDAAITHRIAVMSCKASDIDGSSLTVFETPEPLQGVVVVAPVESKIWTKGQLTAVEVKKPEPRITTGDSQLDRYLRDGWQVDKETITEVHLSKPNGGELKQIVHKKPRSGKTKRLAH